MLSSIHPLGERARSNRWGLTVAAFGIGAVGAGALLGLMAASAGAVTRFASAPAWVPVALIALAAVLELTRVTVPTHHRQVNERWIGTYRGWVYGLGFGAQLGAGFATYIVTWSLPAFVVTVGWIGQPIAGALLGAAFGLGRTIPVLAAGWVDRPDRLSTFNRALANAAGAAHTVGVIVLAALAVSAGAFA